tara:strand:- start:22031 stop:22192 length:162 start_codon:yes stop_codon:yes gene_type:complete
MGEAKCPGDGMRIGDEEVERLKCAGQEWEAWLEVGKELAVCKARGQARVTRSF